MPGRPIMYRTTRKFLEYFGLKDLADLPTLEDLQDELQGELESNVQEEMDFNTSREQNPSPEGGVEDSIQPVNEDPPRIIVPEKKSSSSNEEDAVSPSSANDLDPGV